MRRFFAAALVVGVLTSCSQSQEKTDPAKKPASNELLSPEDQLAKLEAKFEAAQNEFMKEYRAAGSAEERRKIVEGKAPKPEKFVGEFMALAKKYPQSEAAVGALVWVVDNAGQTPAVKDAIKMLAADHVKRERIGEVCESLSQLGSTEAEGLLNRILSDNPAKSAQAAACFALAQLNQQLADAARQAKTAGNTAALEAEYGAERVAALKAGPDAFQKKAEGYYDAIIEKYADEKRQNSTFGESAKGELFELRNLAIGKPAPEIVLKNLEDKEVKLSDLKGKVVVLDIWATWCGPCKQMIPHERELVKRLEGKPFEFVSISFDESKETLEKFLKKEPMPWTHWFNGASGPLGKAWNIKYFPTIFVLDSKGVIRFKGVRGEEMDKAVETLLAEMK